MGDFFETSNSKVKSEDLISTNGIIIKQEPDVLETVDKNLQEWKTSNKFLETIKIEDVAGLYGTSIKVDCGDRYIDEQDDLKDQVSFTNSHGDGHKITTHTNFMHEENTKSEAIESTLSDNLIDSENSKCVQCRFCEYKTKNKHALVRHFMAKHNETDEWLQCQFCDYRSKVEVNLKKHLYYSHNDNVKWHACPSCEFKTKRKARLTDHMNYKHNAEAEWLQCSFCDYKTKLKTTFRQHVRYKHGDNLEWHHCKLCEYKTKYRSNLLTHHKNKHAENVEHYHCEVCDYKTKIRGHLIRHQRSQHEGNGEWHRCKVCEYKTKLKPILDHHFLSKHDKHDIIPEWFHCQFCRHKTKTKNKLSRHIKLHHAKGVDNVVNSNQNKEILEDEAMASNKVDCDEQMTIKCNVDDKTDHHNDYMEENMIEFVMCEKNIKKEVESFTHIEKNAVYE